MNFKKGDLVCFKPVLDSDYTKDSFPHLSRLMYADKLAIIKEVSPARNGWPDQFSLTIKISDTEITSSAWWNAGSLVYITSDCSVLLAVWEDKYKSV